MLLVGGMASGKNGIHSGVFFRILHHIEHRLASRADSSELFSHTYKAFRPRRGILDKHLGHHDNCEGSEDGHNS